MIEYDVKLCMANGERLARIETKLDQILDHPCAQCQNTEKLTRLSTEMRVVKWVGGLVTSGFIISLIEGWIK